MTAISLLNAVMSLVLVACILFLLVRFIEMYNPVERLGHGLAGTSAFLSIFKQLGFMELVAPFTDLYQLLWRVGWLMLLGGKLWRLERHRRRNQQQIQAYLAWKRGVR